MKKEMYYNTVLGSTCLSALGAATSVEIKDKILHADQGYQIASQAFDTALESPDTTTLGQLHSLEEALNQARELVDYGIWDDVGVLSMLILFVCAGGAILFKPSSKS